MRCPRCGEDGPRVLAVMNPKVVLECSECGRVWNEKRWGVYGSKRTRGMGAKRKEMPATGGKIGRDDLEPLRRLRRVIRRRYRASLKRSFADRGSLPSSGNWNDEEVH